jgi:hypothetical protein
MEQDKTKIQEPLASPLRTIHFHLPTVNHMLMSISLQQATTPLLYVWNSMHSQVLQNDVSIKDKPNI